MGGGALPRPLLPFVAVRRKRKTRRDAGTSKILHAPIPDGLVLESVGISAIYGDVGVNPTVSSLYQSIRDVEPASSAGCADPRPDYDTRMESPEAAKSGRADARRRAFADWP